jgi:hypothetical protein
MLPVDSFLDGTTVGTPLNGLVLTGTRQEVDASGATGRRMGGA